MLYDEIDNGLHPGVCRGCGWGCGWGSGGGGACVFVLF